MGLISFAESSFFPIPPDVMVVPMILARRDQAWLIATVCTLSSVAGGMLGYAIGYFLYDSVGQWLMKVYGMTQGIEQFRHWYAEWGAAIILIKGLTPIPYKIVTIASGAAKFNFAVFLAASVVTRGARFFLLAFLLRRYGPPIRDFIERRLTLVTSGAAAGIVVGFVALKYL